MKQKSQLVFFTLVFYFSLSFLVFAYSNTLVGSIPGQFNVGSTGAAEYSIPIELPPGTAGVQPQLSLNYNSQGGNGLLGVGWSLGGLSVIHRCPATKAKDGFIDEVDFDSNDRFCLDGQPLIAISGTYGAANTEYRTELDGFSKIVSYGSTGNGPQYFKVWTKSGDIMEYGNSLNIPNDSLVNPPFADGTTQPDALCWLLNKVSDSVGNYMTITYFEDETTGENYPLSINYTGNANQNLTPYNSVEFEYESRSDTRVSYTSGLKRAANNRLVKIEVNALSKIREYNLNYTIANTSNQSVIENVDMCDGQSNCLGSTNIIWNSATVNTTPWQDNLDYKLPASIAVNINGEVSDYGVRFVDLNGDGLQDIVQSVYWNASDQPSKAWLNTGTGWVESLSYAPRAAIVTKIGDQVYDYGVRFVDLNGDGLQDMVHSVYWSASDQPSKAWLNTGSGWETTSTPEYEPPAAIVTKIGDQIHDYGVRFVDLNGDGLQDMVHSVYWSTSDQPSNTWLNDSDTNDRVIEIENTLGITIGIDYKPITDSSIYSDGIVNSRIYKNSDASLECDNEYVSPNCSIVNIQPSMYVVSQSRTDNGVGSQNSFVIVLTIIELLAKVIGH